MADKLLERAGKTTVQEERSIRFTADPAESTELTVQKMFEFVVDDEPGTLYIAPQIESLEPDERFISLVMFNQIRDELLAGSSVADIRFTVPAGVLTIKTIANSRHYWQTGRCLHSPPDRLYCHECGVEVSLPCRNCETREQFRHSEARRKFALEEKIRCERAGIGPHIGFDLCGDDFYRFLDMRSVMLERVLRSIHRTDIEKTGGAKPPGTILDKISKFADKSP